MDAFWRVGLGPMAVVRSDAFKGNPFMRWQALTHDRVSKVGHVQIRRRALRVLVVEDEQDTSDQLIWQVRRWGHAVRLARDGRAALQVAADDYPDVVLLDIDMPFTDGCQVARQLRLDFPGKDCFIIAATRRTDDASSEECTESGIDLRLVKPVDPALVETLLLLECELVNRSSTDNASATKVLSKFTHEKPSADKKGSGATTARTRLLPPLRAHNYRQSRYETGGFSC